MAIPLGSQRFESMPEFKASSDDIKSYFEMFENFVELNEVLETKKLRLFLNIVGSTVYGELQKILVPDRPTDNTFAEIQEVLEQYYSPEYSVIVERCTFNNACRRKENASVFITELKHLAHNCEFKALLNDALRDRLVVGLRDHATQRILFATENLTSEKACKIALEKELAAKRTMELHCKPECSTDINAVSRKTQAKPGRRHIRTKGVKRRPLVIAVGKGTMQTSAGIAARSAACVLKQGTCKRYVEKRKSVR